MGSHDPRREVGEPIETFTYNSEDQIHCEWWDSARVKCNRHPLLVVDNKVVRARENNGYIVIEEEVDLPVTRYKTEFWRDSEHSPRVPGSYPLRIPSIHAKVLGEMQECQNSPGS